MWNGQRRQVVSNAYFSAENAEKFNSRLVVPTPCNIKSRRWLRMRPATGFELLLGVVVLTADFKFRIESGRTSPSEPIVDTDRGRGRRRPRCQTAWCTRVVTLTKEIAQFASTFQSIRLWLKLRRVVGPKEPGSEHATTGMHPRDYAVIRSCSAPSASGSVPGSTLATAVSRGRRFRPPDRRRGRS